MAEAPDMAFGQFRVDQPSQPGFHRGLDRRSAGCPPGPVQELVIDVDQTFRHTDEYISISHTYTLRWPDAPAYPAVTSFKATPSFSSARASWGPSRVIPTVPTSMP